MSHRSLSVIFSSFLGRPSPSPSLPLRLHAMAWPSPLPRHPAPQASEASVCRYPQTCKLSSLKSEEHCSVLISSLCLSRGCLSLAGFSPGLCALSQSTPHPSPPFEFYLWNQVPPSLVPGGGGWALAPRPLRHLSTHESFPKQTYTLRKTSNPEPQKSVQKWSGNSLEKCLRTLPAPETTSLQRFRSCGAVPSVPVNLSSCRSRPNWVLISHPLQPAPPPSCRSCRYQDVFRIRSPNPRSPQTMLLPYLKQPACPGITAAFVRFICDGIHSIVL